MKYYIKTYGCAMNYADSREIAEMLNSARFQQIKNAQEADIIILNSCSIRQQAEDKVIGWNLKTEKKGFKDKIIILTGCMAVRYDRSETPTSTIPEYSNSLAKKFDWLDAVVDIRDIKKLPEIINKIKEKSNQINKKNDKTSIKDPYNFQALVPISTGCNNFCSYCIVPYTRGPLAPFSEEKIFKNIEKSLKNGNKIITLLGQNVNNWSNPESPGDNNFPKLLKKITEIKGDFWINFLSSNPQDWSTELTKLIINEPKIMKWLNLALQSGSDRILKKMNRKYTVAEFITIVKEIRSSIPDFRITTDIVVGFPGESDADFQKTLDLIKELEFDMLYIGKYSPRKGTFSAKNYEDNVPFKVKKERENKLKDILKEISLKRNGKFINNDLKILPIDKQRGISYYNHDVSFEKLLRSVPGTFIKKTVIESNSNGLVVDT